MKSWRVKQHEAECVRQYHGLLHDLVNDGRAPAGGCRDHVRVLERWFTSMDAEVLSDDLP